MNLPWRIHREIADTYQTEHEARQAYLRINRFLEEIERWPGPYVPPAVAEQDPEPTG